MTPPRETRFTDQVRDSHSHPTITAYGADTVAKWRTRPYFCHNDFYTKVLRKLASSPTVAISTR